MLVLLSVLVLVLFLVLVQLFLVLVQLLLVLVQLLLVLVLLLMLIPQELMLLYPLAGPAGRHGDDVTLRAPAQHGVWAAAQEVVSLLWPQ